VEVAVQRLNKIEKDVLVPLLTLTGSSRGNRPMAVRKSTSNLWKMRGNTHTHIYSAIKVILLEITLFLHIIFTYRRPMIDLSKLDYCPKPCVPAFQLKPSLGSAFLPLQQPASPTMVASASPSAHTTPTTPPPNP